jgi:hypothetical protein
MAKRQRPKDFANFRNFNEMLERLVIAFDPTLPADLPPWFARREQLSAALYLLATLFNKIERRGTQLRGAGRHLNELASALVDRNSGTHEHPLLDADRPPVTRADPSRTWRARAQVVLALEALIAAGESESDAAAKIARSNPSIKKGLAGAKSGELKATLVNWRGEFRKKRVKNFEAGELFKAGLKFMERHKADAIRLRELSKDWLLAAKRVFSPGA